MDSKIIQTILLHLSPEDLRIARLVNKKWNQEVCKLLQSKVLVEFHHVTDISTYLSTFYRDHLSEDAFPFPHNRFHFHKIRLNLIQDNYLLRTFFKKFNKVNSLSKVQLDFSGPQFRLKYFRMCLLENMTNVKSVNLTFKDFYEVWPASLGDDIDPFPLKNVEELIIYGYGRENSLREVMSKIIPFFPNISRLEAGERIGRLIFEQVFIESFDENKSCFFLNLKDVSFNFLYPAEFEAIIVNNLKLRSLTGQLKSCKESHLRNLLDHLSLSLVELNLEVEKNSLSFPSPKSCMTSLLKLELKGFILDLKDLENFPKLKSLKLSRVKISLSDNESSKVSELTSLSIEQCLFNEESISWFSNIFPNLKVLDLPFFVFYDKGNLLPFLLKEMHSLEQIQLTLIDSLGKDSFQNGKDALKEVVGTSVKVSENRRQGERAVRAIDRESLTLLGYLVC